MRRVPVDPDRLDHAGEFELDAAASHYIRDVLRIPTGSSVELFDGQGRACEAVLNCDDSRIRASTGEIRTIAPQAPTLTLYQAIPKGDRWEWLLEKATELGVDRIVPIETARSVVRIPEKKRSRKAQRWNEIVRSAARQSGRYHTPVVELPAKLAVALSNVGDELGFVGSPDAEADLVTQVRTSGSARIALWVGPEGGWTADELSTLTQAGISAVRMTDHTLRSETAGMFGVGLIRLAARP